MGGEFDPAQSVGLTCGNHHSRVVGAVDGPGMGNGPLERASIGLDIFIFLRKHCWSQCFARLFAVWVCHVPGICPIFYRFFPRE